MHNRLTGLDLLRSIIMIFGPVFHASMLYNGAWGFDYQLYKNPWIVDALNLTHPFRMELFFMISGFFSSLLIARKGSEHFIESRIKRVLKPTFWAVIITLPIIASEMYFLFGDRRLGDYLSYKHLWFLIVLSQISLLLMSAPDKINTLARNLADTLNKMRWVSVFTLFLTVIYASVALSKAVSMFLPRAFLSITQLAATLQYLPFFMAGMILFFVKKNIAAKSALFLVLLYFIWFLANVYFDGKHKLTFKVAEVVAVLSVCMALFFIFKNLKIKQSTAITALSKLALPFYLTHLPILIFLGWLGSEYEISRNPLLFLSYVVTLNVVVSFIASVSIRKSPVISRFLGLA